MRNIDAKFMFALHVWTEILIQKCKDFNPEGRGGVTIWPPGHPLITVSVKLFTLWCTVFRCNNMHVRSCLFENFKCYLSLSLHPFLRLWVKSGKCQLLTPVKSLGKKQNNKWCIISWFFYSILWEISYFQLSWVKLTFLFEFKLIGKKGMKLNERWLHWASKCGILKWKCVADTCLSQ